MSRKWVAVDDLDDHEHDRETRADETVIIAFAVGGEWETVAQLDLTSPHTEEVREWVKRYKAAGTHPDVLPALKTSRHTMGPPDLKGRVQYGKELRAWMDERGFWYKNPDSGKYYHRMDARKAFARWQQTGEEPSEELAAELRLPTMRKGRRPAS